MKLKLMSSACALSLGLALTTAAWAYGPDLENDGAIAGGTATNVEIDDSGNVKNEDSYNNEPEQNDNDHSFNTATLNLTATDNSSGNPPIIFSGNVSTGGDLTVSATGSDPMIFFYGSVATSGGNFNVTATGNTTAEIHVLGTLGVSTGGGAVARTVFLISSGRAGNVVASRRM